MPPKERFLTIGEAAAFLHVSEVSLRRWTNSGKLRCFRVGGRNERRFLVADLLAFMPAADSPTEGPALDLPGAPGAAPAPADYSERHISMFFRDAEEQWSLVRPYIVEYLRAGYPVFYLQHMTSSEELMARLRAEDLPLDKLIARGLLRVLPPSQTYLLTGRFSGQWMLDFLEMTVEATLEAGHTRILMTGEMSWSLPAAPGADELARYEDELNQVVDKYPMVTFICQYDLKRFTGDIILDALLTHPSILVAPGTRLAPGYHGL